jgi:hypothetical protein
MGSRMGGQTIVHVFYLTAARFEVVNINLSYINLSYSDIVIHFSRLRCGSNQFYKRNINIQGGTAACSALARIKYF